MTEKPAPPPLKALSPVDWETLIDDFQYGGPRRHKWTSLYPFPSLLDLLLSSLLRKDFPLSLKLQLLVFLEEFSDSPFTHEHQSHFLDRLVDTVRTVINAPVDGVHVTFTFKEQLMASTTSVLICLDVFDKFQARYTVSLVELLLTVINRPNYGLDRHTRAIACECLRELESANPCLLSEIVGHLWGLCQNERTHASQSYILLFTSVIYNIVAQKLNVSILNTSIPMVPFNVPQWLLGSNGEISGLNYKELRKAMAFLLEWPQVMTPCGIMEFMAMIMPVAVALELQPSMLKVQFFGMIYSYDPMLCHVVLMMYLHFLDAFDGLEGEISRRLLLISREAQHFLVFRLLAVQWLLGYSKLIFCKEVGKTKPVIKLYSNFYPTLFDPLALKALKLDLLAFCSICVDILKSKGHSHEEVYSVNSVKLFEDGLVFASSFKWLPPGSTETAIVFRTLHKFLMSSSSHSDCDPSATRDLMNSMIFCTLKGMLVDMMLDGWRLIPVIVVFIDRFLSCQKHSWLGERLLQKFDEDLLPKVRMDYKLVSYFPLFDRIAENETIPPRGLLELLTNFIIFLVEKHGPNTGMKSWSQGSRVLGVCRTMLMHHHSSRLFLRLSRLLAFTCLYFPDLEVRDNARIYLRMLICIPGKKLRDILNLGDLFLGISPSSHSSSFYSVQSPRLSQKFKTFKNLSSCIHLERATPLLVKQFWSLSLSNMGVGNSKPAYLEGVRDSEAPVEEKDFADSSYTNIICETGRISQPKEPLRVMDSKVSEILNTLRNYFSCIPDFRYMPGLKVQILCSLRLDSNNFNRMLGIDNSATPLEEIGALPAIYATVLHFSSSAPYGSIPSYRIPFLLGELYNNVDASQNLSLSIVPVENGSREEDKFRAPVVIELEPREPTPGVVDVHIETNAENGQIIQGQLQGIMVGIEDMFLKAVVPSDIAEDAIPRYNLDLFNALWEACGTSSNTGRETFPLKGSKGVAAISGTQSVKLLDIPSTFLIQATERHLACFVVSVTGEPLIDIVRGGDIIKNIIWDDASYASLDAASVPNFDTGPLFLTYNDEYEKEGISNGRKRNLGCIHVLIFLPPRFHLLFQMEVCDVSTLVRIRTDHWPSLAYIDDYLEALYLS